MITILQQSVKAGESLAFRFEKSEAPSSSVAIQIRDISGKSFFHTVTTNDKGVAESSFLVPLDYSGLVILTFFTGRLTSDDVTVGIES